jgi:hypothetical protein
MYDPIWICRDGRQMRVGQMSDAHLLNAIIYVDRVGGPKKARWMDRLLLEVVIRKVQRYHGYRT